MRAEGTRYRVFFEHFVYITKTPVLSFISMMDNRMSCLNKATDAANTICADDF